MTTTTAIGRSLTTFANALNTQLVDRARTESQHRSTLATVSRAAVSTPKSILTLFSGVMASVTSINLATKWEEFKSEGFLGKLKMLFVPIVSSIATILPNIITAIWADEIPVDATKTSLPPYTETLKNNILSSFINGLVNNLNNNAIDESFTDNLISNFSNTIKDDKNRSTINNLMLEVFKDENNQHYLQAIHKVNADTYTDLYSNSNDLVYSLRFRPIDLNKITKDSTFEIIFLYKKYSDNDNNFRPLVNINTKLEEIITNLSIRNIVGKMGVVRLLALLNEKPHLVLSRAE